MPGAPLGWWVARPNTPTSWLRGRSKWAFHGFWLLAEFEVAHQRVVGRVVVSAADSIVQAEDVAVRVAHVAVGDRVTACLCFVVFALLAGFGFESGFGVADEWGEEAGGFVAWAGLPFLGGEEDGLFWVAVGEGAVCCRVEFGGDVFCSCPFVARGTTCSLLAYSNHR